LSDQKKRVDHITKNLFDAEFSKGQTKAVLDAAGKALVLIDRDSLTGIEASKAIKRYGLQNLVNIRSICFKVPLESLASSCINMHVNMTTAGSNEEKSYPLKTCLNKDLVPNIARFVANTMFPDVTGARQRRSLLSEEREPGADFEAQDAEFEVSANLRLCCRFPREQSKQYWDVSSSVNVALM
jgi:hypothetical protein